MEGGKAFVIKAYSVAMKRNIKIVVHYPESGGHKIYFSTDLDMSGRDIIGYYRTRFQIEFLCVVINVLKSVKSAGAAFLME